jgi:hypothetical protein
MAGFSKIMKTKKGNISGPENNSGKLKPELIKKQ